MTDACGKLQETGTLIRTRPLQYSHTPQLDLDSYVSFTQAVKLRVSTTIIIAQTVLLTNPTQGLYAHSLSPYTDLYVSIILHCAMCARTVSIVKMHIFFACFASLFVCPFISSVPSLHFFLASNVSLPHLTGHHVWNPCLPVDGLLCAGCLHIHNVGPLTNQHLLLLHLPLTLYLADSDLHAYDIVLRYYFA